MFIFVLVSTYYNEIKLIFRRVNERRSMCIQGTVRACAAGISLYIYIYVYVSETDWAAAKFETAAKKT